LNPQPNANSNYTTQLPPLPEAKPPYLRLTLRHRRSQESHGHWKQQQQQQQAGAYTTIKERVTFEREIKKSKFIAIAGPISDEPSAFSFLSQVFILSSPFSPFPPIVNKRAISTFLKIIPLSG
jgi:hypothetical protein